MHCTQEVELALVKDHFFRREIFMLSGQIGLLRLLKTKREDLMVQLTLRHLFELVKDGLQRRRLVDLSFALLELLRGHARRFGLRLELWHWLRVVALEFVKA